MAKVGRPSKNIEAATSKPEKPMDLVRVICTLPLGLQFEYKTEAQRQSDLERAKSHSIMPTYGKLIKINGANTHRDFDLLRYAGTYGITFLQRYQWDFFRKNYPQFVENHQVYAVGDEKDDQQVMKDGLKEDNRGIDPSNVEKTFSTAKDKVEELTPEEKNANAA